MPLTKKLNVRYATGKQIEVAGAKQSRFILHNRLKVMAYKSNNLFHNSEDYIVKSFNETTMTSINDTDSSEIVVDLKFTSCFKPMYDITCHKAQGMTINQPYSIYEYQRLKHDMLHVCLTWTSKQYYVNSCDIDCHKTYTGYIYKYSYNDISYIGATNDIDKRKQKHKEHNTFKYGRALKQYGYDNFNLKC